MTYSRRQFLKTAGAGAGMLGILPLMGNLGSFYPKTNRELNFIPYPHKWMPPIEFLYLSDEFGDPFKSEVALNQAGISIEDLSNSRQFSVNTRWFVEGFGYIYLQADNGGEYYSPVKTTVN